MERLFIIYSRLSGFILCVNIGHRSSDHAVHVAVKGGVQCVSVV